jgi:hypothetical protein
MKQSIFAGLAAALITGGLVATITPPAAIAAI